MRIVCDNAEEYALIQHLKQKNIPELAFLQNAVITRNKPGQKKVLSESQINEIKKSLAEGESVSALARKYNVCRNTIYRTL